MRNHTFKSAMTKFSAPFLLATAIVALAGCSDNTASTATTTTTPTPVAGVISLGTSANWIPTDNSTSATLTATLVDSSNALMSGVAVSFATTSGNLTASSATTDVNGQATVALKSGLADFSNRTATVTATVSGQSASVPILIRGSTVALALTPSDAIQVGAGTLAATATATNATGLGMPNMTIRFSIGATSTGSATLSAATLTTDATGVTIPTLTITPTAPGTVVLTAEWLDSAGAVTATATKDIIVTAASGVAFAITTPSANPLALSTVATQALAVTVPATIAGTTVASVRISATSGTWTGSNPATGPLTSIIQTPSAGAVAATYTAPNNSGSVTVQVDALGTVSGVPLSTLSTLSRTFVISAPATSAVSVMLNVSASTIAPSSGGNISISTLQATVRDMNYNSVGGAAVMFGLLGTTGSGETVAPAVVYTDSQGIATTTFSAGTSPTLGSIYAQVRLVGEVCIFSPNPLAAETNSKCDSAPMMVSSTAVSVSIGFGTAITDLANSTMYSLPGSVLVVNSNGSPVAGATVTLTVFPAKYRNGSIYPVTTLVTPTTSQTDCGGPFVATSGGGLGTGFTANEDINRNGILDDGTFIAPIEDTPALMTASQIAALAIPNNGLISPPQAAGGVVPMTVTTDSNGIATFDLLYPKSSAWFIEDEVTARVMVMGTESSAKVNYILPMSLTDAADDNCTIGRTASY